MGCSRTPRLRFQGALLTTCMLPCRVTEQEDNHRSGAIRLPSSDFVHEFGRGAEKGAEPRVGVLGTQQRAGFAAKFVAAGVRSAGRGGQLPVRLQKDLLTLNTNSRISVRDTPVCLSVRIFQGDILFHIDHSKGRCMEVWAGDALISDIGTTFDVYLTEDKSHCDRHRWQPRACKGEREYGFCIPSRLRQRYPSQGRTWRTKSDGCV